MRHGGGCSHAPPVTLENPDLALVSDSSNVGWSVVFQGQTAQGAWSEVEAQAHINYLELKAAFLGLQTFCSHMQKTHIRQLMDNATYIAYVLPLITWVGKYGNGAQIGKAGSVLPTYLASAIWLMGQVETWTWLKNGNSPQ